ncbi:ABC transporter ATP-binding protein [Bradyrhizobium sp. 195]|uniref:ABC transporter ATP-binding protein n=1 Tax=Bradyrhizobium sp. 195 TaxID=2782662 RepID=UPI0020018C56|nr:ABC transporter ATP-binding protein [Bradyrhizobium sp. 195]UPK28282.1 ABC transporter ATP-binding protein [Bradyrhizobium sp. 195]
MLSVHGLRAGYNGMNVLNGVNFDLSGAEIVSLVGRNGSGRSTMMQALLRIVKPSAGEVILNGCSVDNLKTYQIVRAGLSYVPEERLVFHNLTVRENMMLGIQRRRNAVATWHPDEFWSIFPNLATRRDVAAGALSGGEQQMLTMCRSLLGNPDAILIDEPTEGLAPKIVEAVVGLILEMKRRGIGVVLVEQKLTVALKISDRVTVMGHGTIVFEGSPQELRTRDDVRRKWLEV